MNISLLFASSPPPLLLENDTRLVISKTLFEIFTGTISLLLHPNTQQQGKGETRGTFEWCRQGGIIYFALEG